MIQIKSTHGSRGWLVFVDSDVPVNKGQPLRSIKDACALAGKHGAVGGWIKELDQGARQRRLWAENCLHGNRCGGARQW